MNLTSKDKLVVGLTGCILSGKSLALSFFKDCGAETLSADVLAHEALESAPGKKAVLAAFGTCAREELAGQIFKNAASRKKLETILHPLVLREASARIGKSRNKIIVFEVPLLFEAGWENLFDLTLCVLADPKSLPARLEGRRLSLAEYERRKKAQWPEEKKAFAADISIFHAGTEDLGKHVTRVYDALYKIYR